MEKISLYELREKTNLNCRDFAKALGVSTTLITCYEIGSRRITEHFVDKVKATFNVDIDTSKTRDHLLHASKLGDPTSRTLPYAKTIKMAAKEIFEEVFNKFFEDHREEIIESITNAMITGKFKAGKDKSE